MKNKLLSFVILAVLFAFLAGAQAQDDDSKYKDKEGKKDKSGKANVHFTVDKKSIPKYVEPGQTFTINVDVKNKSKNTNWYSGNLKFDVASPFTFIGSSLSTFTFDPGDYGTIYVNVRAPNSEGKHLLKLVVYDNDRKSRQFVKNITVGSGNSDESSDDDAYKNSDNEKDREKNKENEKNKEKNKENEKNKEKNKENEKNKEKNSNSDGR